MKNKIRHSLRVSVFDGVCASASGAITDNFVTPLAIALQASAAQIAGLASLPGLLSAFAQIQAGPLQNRWGHRKALLVGGVAFQVASLITLASVPWWPEAWRVNAIIACMTVGAVFGGFATPMWASLMCEYLPLSRRSGYFGWRSRFLGMMTMSATLAGGLWLHHSGRAHMAGFVWLLWAAALFRLCSLRFLSAMHEPPRAPVSVEEGSYRWCWKASAHYRRFIVCVGLMGFSVNLSGPFLSVYLLKHLQFSYARYTLMILAAQMTMYWMMGRWGRSADRSGNMKVIQLTSKFLALTSLSWIFSHNPIYLFLIQMLGGVVWAGYNLCVANFVYDAVPSRQRVHATALFNTVNGLAMFAGATLGGKLLSCVPAVGGSRFFTVVLIGSAARAFVGWALFPRLREVREVPATRSRDLLTSVFGLDVGAFARLLYMGREARLPD